MHVLLVNPQARRFRSNPRLLDALTATATAAGLNVVMPETAAGVLPALARLHEQDEIDVLYIVGGDGTFSLALNWVLRMPRHERPRLALLGGGQICYMARYLRMPSADPLVNLRAVLADNGRHLFPISWKPLMLHEPNTDTVWYAAVFANGLVHDFIERYDELGKGSMFMVAAMIAVMAANLLLFPWRGLHRRLRHSTRVVAYETNRRPQQTTGTEVASSIARILPWGCRPFREKNIHRSLPPGQEFYVISYWGTLWPLALALPFVWFGWEPKWIAGKIFNCPQTSLRIHPSDAHFILDGDRLTPDHPLFVPLRADVDLWIAPGPAVMLLAYEPL